MPVYAASDLHGNLPDVPSDAELILLAGDICPDFRGPGGPYGVDKGGLKQASWLTHYFAPWAKAHGIPIIAIWGNHDFVGETTLWSKSLPWTMLEDRHVHVQTQFGSRGFDVYGTPWVPGLPYWAFYADDRKLQLRAEAIPEGLDVLMTHGPPKGAGDFIPTSEKQRNKYGNFGGEHVGDPTLNARLLEMTKPPKVVICGHIHEDRGAHSVGSLGRDVPVYNVAAVDENYVLHKNPWTRLYELEA